MLWLLPSVLIVVLVVVGPLGTSTGLLDTEPGWALFFSGVGLALVSLPLMGGAAAFASATGKAWRSNALRGALVPLLAVLGLIVPNLARLNPVIHDITSDPQDALQFTPDVAAVRAERMDRARVLELQRSAYPDIEPVRLPMPPEKAFAVAIGTAADMPRWRVVAEDAAAGQIVAISTSRIFRFVDDVVIRVQPDPVGSRIDIRSRSRFGEGDFGVNAARVRTYLTAVREKASALP